MIDRRALLLGGGALGLPTGCGGHQPVVVRQVFPNPFRGQQQFAVLPLRFDGLVVNDRAEADWLRERAEDSRASWEADKRAMTEQFVLELMNRALGAGIAIYPNADPRHGLFAARGHVVSIETGYFAGFMAQASKVRLDLELLAPDGRSLDTVELESTTPGSMVNASIGNRVQHDAGELGRMAAEYLESRARGG